MWPVAATMAFALSAAIPADAGLILEYSGFFGPQTSGQYNQLGTTDIPDGIAFTFQALFDPTLDTEATPDVGVFAISQFAIAIYGADTYTGLYSGDTAAGSWATNVKVVLFDQTPGLGNGLTMTTGFLGLFGSNAPAIDPDTPSDTVYSTYVTFSPSFPYLIPLLGDDLTIRSLSNGTGHLAQLFTGNSLTLAPPPPPPSPVPEPSSLALVALALCGVAIRRRSPPAMT
jgi:hypothetical protein